MAATRTSLSGLASPPVGRRQFLAGTGATLIGAALGGCSLGPRNAAQPEPPVERLRLPALEASPDRIIAITVCTRPFRAQGPRLDVEQIQGKTVVHNYGHGGSGWSHGPGPRRGRARGGHDRGSVHSKLRASL